MIDLSPRKSNSIGLGDGERTIYVCSRSGNCKSCLSIEILCRTHEPDMTYDSDEYLLTLHLLSVLAETYELSLCYMFASLRKRNKGGLNFEAIGMHSFAKIKENWAQYFKVTS